MRRGRTRRMFSYLLIGCGASLLFLGARDYLESRYGQREAARQFEEPAPSLPSNTAEAPSIPAEQPVPDGAISRPQPSKDEPGRREHAIQTGDTLAKLIIPRLDAELYVVEGDGPSELRRGPGHLIGTAMPGENGNCVIAGHRDTHFRVLKNIQKGDDIVLQTKTGKYLYRVREMKIVTPDNTSSLQPTSDSELNLITCYPFYYVGSAPRRFVVEARLAGLVSRAS